MSRSAPERPTAVSSSPRSQRTELSVPTPRAIVAVAGRPALIVTPSAFVTSTLAIAAMAAEVEDAGGGSHEDDAHRAGVESIGRAGPGAALVGAARE